MIDPNACGDVDVTALNIETDYIVEQIKPLLAGRNPGVQGIVLADLVALWLAGHPPELQSALTASHLRGVAKLVPLYREMLVPDEARHD